MYFSESEVMGTDSFRRTRILRSASDPPLSQRRRYFLCVDLISSSKAFCLGTSIRLEGPSTSPARQHQGSGWSTRIETKELLSSSRHFGRGLLGDLGCRNSGIACSACCNRHSAAIRSCAEPAAVACSPLTLRTDA